MERKSMAQVHRLFPFALLAGIALASPASAQEHDCPNHPESTYTLRGDPDADKSELERMADEAKAKGAVCIVSFYDSKGPANGKMLAFRRANWTMEQLTGSGVPAGTISRVLRASDKQNARKVQVVLGP
jgi:hypothetical protein